jgi:putative transposase
MPNYRRAWRAGGTYFFTLNLLERTNNDLLVRYIDVLREAVRKVRMNYPFIIHAWVVLPEHVHCVIEMPEGDTDFAMRLRLIKIHFSKAIPKNEALSRTRIERGERGIWQRRYWEHLIRDERDFSAHMDYVHINPLKHGLVKRVCDWPFSTFHALVNQEMYPANWTGGDEDYCDYVD